MYVCEGVQYVGNTTKGNTDDALYHYNEEGIYNPNHPNHPDNLNNPM